MKKIYLILILVFGVLAQQSWAPPPGKGGATGGATALHIVGKACGGKKVAELKCSFSASSGADYASLGSCENKSDPIKIKAGEQVIGLLGVKVDLYRGSKDSLNSEYCINVTTNLNASNKNQGGKRLIPSPNDPLTLKVFIFSEADASKPPVHSEAITIQIDKSRLKETLDPGGLVNAYNVSFKLSSGASINRLRFSLLPVITGNFLSSPGDF
jgi:hypothetical protein